MVIKLDHGSTDGRARVTKWTQPLAIPLAVARSAPAPGESPEPDLAIIGRPSATPNSTQIWVLLA